MQQHKAYRSSHWELGPDAKAQVSVAYKNGRPAGVKAIVVSSQHRHDVSLTRVRELLREEIVRPVFGNQADGAELHLNSAGTFVEGGPIADAGLTGRKIIVDTYGGFARHGRGAFSGKDGSKVDRSAAYAARQLALSLLEYHQADGYEVRLAYAIGRPQPVALHIDLAGGDHQRRGGEAEARLLAAMHPGSIIERLGLQRPRFLDTAAFGHFGRQEFAWERSDKELCR